MFLFLTLYLFLLAGLRCKQSYVMQLWPAALQKWDSTWNFTWAFRWSHVKRVLIAFQFRNNKVHRRYLVRLLLKFYLRIILLIFSLRYTSPWSIHMIVLPLIMWRFLTVYPTENYLCTCRITSNELTKTLRTIICLEVICVTSITNYSQLRITWCILL